MFFQTHTLSNGTTARSSLAVYPLDDEITLSWQWLFLQHSLFFQEVYSQSIQDKSLFSPSGNELQHKPCPPHFSRMSSRSRLYLTSHTPCPDFELCLLHFIRGLGMLSESILDGLRQTNDSEMPSHLPDMGDWHSAVGVCGLRDCFLFCVRWSEAALGLGFRGFVRVVKNVPVHFSSCSLLTVH